NQPVINVISGKIIPINNPFASPIDLRKLSSSYNVFYYLWDPNRGGNYGLGAFQTLSWNGSGYDVIPGGGSYGAINNFVDNGQAFFISTLGPDTTVQLTEDIKSIAAFAISPFTPVTAPDQQLRLNLYVVNSDATTTLADGLLCGFSDDYNNAIDGMDARKPTNLGENLSIKNNSQYLVVEKRKIPFTLDTIFLNLTGTGKRQYRFEFILDKLHQSGLDAYMEDQFLATRMPLDVNGITSIDFSIDASAGSSVASRFQIVFEASAAALPVTFTNVNAYTQNKNIIVDWSVENENGIKEYEIQKSADGITFDPGAVVIANNIPASNYKWNDEEPVAGYNYYRIKSETIRGEVKYSDVVRAFIQKGKREIAIYPNPVKNGVINIQFLNQPEGIYQLRLLNHIGQVIISKTLNHAAGNSLEKIYFNKNLMRGLFSLEIVKPGGDKIVEKIFY
ncbi:MAG: hypothetical protein M3Z56_11560, partial [Bacteroidota bacterium]|nr:hypothetical protein [Bacteroidota bacterium]